MVRGQKSCATARGRDLAGAITGSAGQGEVEQRKVKGPKFALFTYLLLHTRITA